MTPFRLLKFLRLWSAITVLAILCITGLEAYAIHRGADPSTLRITTALIAGLAGAGLGRFVIR